MNVFITVEQLILYVSIEAGLYLKSISSG